MLGLLSSIYLSFSIYLSLIWPLMWHVMQESDVRTHNWLVKYELIWISHSSHYISHLYVYIVRLLFRKTLLLLDILLFWSSFLCLLKTYSTDITQHSLFILVYIDSFMRDCIYSCSHDYYYWINKTHFIVMFQIWLFGW